MWWLAVLDIIGVPVTTMWIIWRRPPHTSHAWVILPIWLLATILIHGDTPKTLGARADNLWPSLKRATFVLAPMAGGLIVIGFALGMRPPTGPGAFAPHHFINYFAFCLLQQVALNSLLSNRLYYLTKRIWPTAISAGVIFAIFHWPNPLLIPLTLFIGTVMSWLFIRERNIIPLSLWHMALGILTSWAFPAAWHHALRVGPGYYTYILHH
jgi:hypothetical protein